MMLRCCLLLIVLVSAWSADQVAEARVALAAGPVPAERFSQDDLHTAMERIVLPPTWQMDLTTLDRIDGLLDLHASAPAAQSLAAGQELCRRYAGIGVIISARYSGLTMLDQQASNDLVQAECAALSLQRLLDGYAAWQHLPAGRSRLVWLPVLLGLVRACQRYRDLEIDALDPAMAEAWAQMAQRLNRNHSLAEQVGHQQIDASTPDLPALRTIGLRLRRAWGQPLSEELEWQLMQTDMGDAAVLDHLEYQEWSGNIMRLARLLATRPPAPLVAEIFRFRAGGDGALYLLPALAAGDATVRQQVIDDLLDEGAAPALDEWDDWPWTAHYRSNDTTPILLSYRLEEVHALLALPRFAELVSDLLEQAAAATDRLSPLRQARIVQLCRPQLTADHPLAMAAEGSQDLRLQLLVAPLTIAADVETAWPRFVARWQQLSRDQAYDADDLFIESVLAADVASGGHLDPRPPLSWLDLTSEHRWATVQVLNRLRALLEPGDVDLAGLLRGVGIRHNDRHWFDDLLPLLRDDRSLSVDELPDLAAMEMLAIRGAWQACISRWEAAGRPQPMGQARRVLNIMRPADTLAWCTFGTHQLLKPWPAAVPVIDRINACQPTDGDDLAVQALARRRQGVDADVDWKALLQTERRWGALLLSRDANLISASDRAALAELVQTAYTVDLDDAQPAMLWALARVLANDLADPALHRRFLAAGWSSGLVAAWAAILRGDAQQAQAAFAACNLGRQGRWVQLQRLLLDDQLKPVPSDDVDRHEALLADQPARSRMLWVAHLLRRAAPGLAHRLMEPSARGELEVWQRKEWDQIAYWAAMAAGRGDEAERIARRLQGVCRAEAERDHAIWLLALAQTDPSAACGACWGDPSVAAPAGPATGLALLRRVSESIAEGTVDAVALADLQQQAGYPGDIGGRIAAAIAADGDQLILTTNWTSRTALGDTLRSSDYGIGLTLAAGRDLPAVVEDAVMIDPLGSPEELFTIRVLGHGDGWWRYLNGYLPASLTGTYLFLARIDGVEHLRAIRILPLADPSD